MSSTTVETLSLRIKPGKDLLEQPRSRRTSEVAFQEPGIDFFRQQRINTQSVANGIATHQKVEDDTVQRVPRPQQEALLLHGPGQRYRLERSQDIPALKSDQEILIKVYAIGLNPVDWKGPDYNFGIPSLPWINGRDFSGTVVRGPESSRIKAGDKVFGPSTDYRDPRKAAYQEYVVTNHFNVAKVPTNLSVHRAASIGVAFVSAVLSLGICLGVNFKETEKGPEGPHLLQILQEVDRGVVPQDIRAECFDGIQSAERPRVGDWFAIWGASSQTGLMALQLGKLAGLRIICVADVAKHGARLYRLGADILIDRFDSARAVEIIQSVTGGELRFALDAVGKETAGHLQRCLKSQEGAPYAHLVGLTGLPKQTAPGIKHHQVPIKVFHSTAAIGEPVMVWLEQLLAANVLAPPDIDIAQGGLEGVNSALDQLREGNVSGKRIVVPLGTGSGPDQDDEADDKTGVTTKIGSIEYAKKLNSDPKRIKFAYWVPNVSGGLVISKIAQKTRWDLDSNIGYARTAERVGFEYALTQIRFMAGYGADNQHESVSFSQALLHFTEELILIAALLPGPWNPAVAAKQIASIDNYSKGRIAVNIVSGWFKAEFTSIGQWWLDHAERYRRSKEFIQCLKGIWTQDQFTFSGDFYQFHNYPLKPKPVALPGRPHPEVFQGGNSIDARENAATVSDYYFMNGNTLEGFKTQIADVRDRAKREGRLDQVKFALNGFVIARKTEAEAIRVLEEIQGKANKEAVEAFGDAVQNAGASTANKTGMWANSKFEDLVQYNDGFKTKLIGTPEQIADRILLLKSLGVSILLVAFLHYDDEIQQFGEQVLPLVRKLETEGRGKDVEYEISLTGDVYRERKKEIVS